MAKVSRQRLTAQIEGDFVVFLIGMRVNRFWKPHKWLPVFMAMPKMLKELASDRESGLLGFQLRFGIRSPMVIQYWRSFEALERYARAADREHYPAWVRFNKAVSSNGDVGIWHETYLVKAGSYECMYNNMPAHGLGKASTLVTATERRAGAAQRLGREPAGQAPPGSYSA